MAVIYEKKIRKDLGNKEIINILLYSVIIVMPFIVTNQDKPEYVIGKMIYLYIIGSIILVLLIKEKFIREILKKRNVEMKISLIFLMLILISSIFSVNLETALLGNFFRREGFFMFCVYIILFLSSIKYFEVSKVGLYLILIAANVMSLYGIIQFFGIDQIQDILGIHVNYGQSIGLIGNRNFFSTYLLIFLFISMGLYIFYKEKIYLIFSIPLFGALLCTLTRGGWIGFIVFVFIGLMFILKRKECLNRAIIIFCMFFFVFISIEIMSGGRILQRTEKSNVISEEGEVVGSAGARLNIIKMSFKAFVKRPLLGGGPDTLMEVFKLDFKDDRDSHKEKYGEYVDKAHNEYLEYAASTGIFTLIIYIVLIVYILKGLINNIKDDRSKIMIISLSGYLVQAFFNISVNRVAPLYWIMLGVYVQFIKKDFNVNIHK